MATTNQPVTADQLISATVKYSNRDDANRVFDITANVRIENGIVNNFDSGEVKKHTESSDATDGMAPNVASFNFYGEKNLNLYINNATVTEAKEILSAIYAFVADVKANVNANPVTA